MPLGFWIGALKVMLVGWTKEGKKKPEVAIKGDHMNAVSNDTMHWENEGLAPPALCQPGATKQIYFWKMALLHMSLHLSRAAKVRMALSM